MRWMLTALMCAGLAVAGGDTLEVTFNHATQALAQKDYAAAERGFEQVLAQTPANVGALGNLGVVYSRTNRPGDAVRVYEKALQISPEEKGILLNLGLLYLKQDDYDRALPNFEHLVKLDPGNMQARELLATSQIFSGKAQIAAGELEQLRTTDANKGSVLYLLGVAYIKSGEPDKGRAVFEELFRS